MEVDDDIYSEDAIMDTAELQQLSSKLGIKANFIDLSELNSSDHFYAYVHTGETKNKYNSGITNHWLAVYGRNLFDSYGKYKLWHMPGFDRVDTIPNALQEYDTNVCGMYCAAYISFCKEKNSDGSDDLGREFCMAYGFGKNREENDSIILSWYDQLMGKDTGEAD